MSKLKNLSDRIFFILLCVVLLGLFLMYKSCDLKYGDDQGNGWPAIGNPNDNQNDETDQNTDSQEKKSPLTDLQPSSGLSKIAKLFLGRQGISDDQVSWYDADQFADLIQQLKDRGIREVQYTLLPDSIERYEEKWAEELKKANMRSYIETDTVSFQP